VVYSLVVGNPNDAVVTWEIEKAIDHFLNPVLYQFSNITAFTVSSQILNYATLIQKPRKLQNDYVLYPKELAHYLNSAEWNLASVVSSSPAIHFVLYIPEKSVRY
jgi:phosphatidylinositol glycan class S